MKTGITGGIGSGKSYVSGLLARNGIEVYDCDAAAKRLMRQSAEIRHGLTALVGPEAYRGDELNKAAIARFLLESEDHAKAIDDIVHPAVFQDFIDSGLEWMESAIMFESGINRLVDRVIIVTAPLEVRIDRIMRRDGITRGKALEWIHRQWPQEKVRQLADMEIVNDGQTDLEQQIKNILEKCNRPF